MRYSITDLAELLGVTTSAIRYFEKENLIKVNKEINGNRYYNVVDVFRLLSYTKYKNMEIPMKMIVKQFSGEENNRLIIKERMEEFKNQAYEKARYYQELAEAMEENMNSIYLIDELLDKYEFAKSPKILLLYDEECGWISKNRESQKVVHQWVKAMPTVQLAVIKHMENNCSNFGYIVLDDKADELNLPMDLNVKILESTSCLHTIQRVDDELTLNPDVVFEKGLSYAKYRGLEITGDIIGKILIVEVEKPAKLHTYIELWIPIK
ncbi:hypothetical protein TPDSL_19400 [Terrisporobacter petrolearius]|uniref:MerR family transcriptional regulator n=1 Tax=Terrisporobacter petrolearius TaxID=1460447 RepID=UPI0033691B02